MASRWRALQARALHTSGAFRVSGLYLAAFVLGFVVAGVFFGTFLTAFDLDRQVERENYFRLISVPAQGTLVETGYRQHGDIRYSYIYDGRRYDTEGRYGLPNPSVDLPQAGTAVYLSLDPLDPLHSCACDPRRMPPVAPASTFIVFMAVTGGGVFMLNLAILRHRNAPRHEVWDFNGPAYRRDPPLQGVKPPSSPPG